MAQQGTSRSFPSLAADVTPSIPDKLYFRIGEVADLCGVPTYVLRFWEGEFPQLKPNKGGTGQRLYRRKDVEMVLRIRELLYAGKFTIAGARQALRNEQNTPQLALAIVESGDAEPKDAQPVDRRVLSQLQQELRELRDMLLSPRATGPKYGSVQPIRARRMEEADARSEDLFS